jgi:hypothetical protein
MILPQGGENHVAIDMIVSRIRVAQEAKQMEK